MPVSNPTYFPPQRSTGSIIGITAGVNVTAARDFLAGQAAGNNSNIDDLIVLGYQALDSGVTDANGVGSIVIGSNALGALDPTVGFSGSFAGPSVVIGSSAAAALIQGGSNAIVGAFAAQLMVANNLNTGACAGNVILGTYAAQNLSVTSGFGTSGSVVIGFRAAQGAGAGAPRASLANCVVIGRDACGSLGNFPLQSSVIIGTSAAQTAAHNGTSAGVVIGANAGVGIVNGEDNVLVGRSAGVNDGSFSVVLGCSSGSLGGGVSTSQAVVVGSNSSIGASQTVVVGYSAGNTSLAANNVAIGWKAGNTLTGVGNILIGAEAGNTEAGALANRFIVENGTNTILFGEMANGNLVVGKSAAGVNRDIPGTNALKLINGTASGVAPVAGGFLYAATGKLRWVDSLNVELALQGGQSFTVATLPNATNAGIGARTIVTDATLTAITGLGLAPTGGGANIVPVYSDGTQWLML